MPPSRSEVLNFVFEERPKFLAAAWSLLGDCQSAERVFQELLTALDKRPPFEEPNSLQDWCWHLLHNRCQNLNARGTYRRESLPPGLVARLDEELQSRDRQEVADYAEALRPCLSLLSENARWVIQAFYVDGKRGLEAARLLNLNPATFYRVLQRIYTSLSKSQQKRVPMGRIPRVDANPRDAEFERLAFRYLDDELTPEETAAFAHELAADGDRVRQFNDLRLSCALLRDCDANLIRPMQFRGNPLSKYAEQRRRKRIWAFSYLTATLIVCALVGVFSLIRINDRARMAKRGAPAAFVRGADVKFFGRKAPKFGDPLGRGDYTLTRGTARLQFRKGAEVTVEGPAEFSIGSEEKVKLHRGTVTAIVPPSAVGFTIDTEFATIRDLGTEFGVVASPGSTTEVVVFEGRVEVSGEALRGIYLLKEGDGFKVSKNGEITNLISSKEAFRFPRSLPSSDPPSSPDNLLKNASFEIGPLSRAPHSGPRYRDMATCWIPGQMENERWREHSALTPAGTVVRPSEDAQVPPLPDGERCLYLKNASARQKIRRLRSGARYQLSVGVGRPLDETSAAEVTLGLMAGDESVDLRSTTIPGGPESREFTELHFEFTMPPLEDALAEAPNYFVLSTANGTVFFDNLRLARSSQ